MNIKYKVFRTATVAVSLDILLSGQLRYLNNYFAITAISGYDSNLQAVKDREGIEVIDIRMSRQISIINDIISLIRLFLLFRREKPRIVHSITPKAGLLSMVAAKLAGVPIRLHTFTGLLFPTETGLKKYVLMYADRLLCSCASRVYPEGVGVMNDLVNFKITKKPLKLILNGNINGVNTEYFKTDHFSEYFKMNMRKELNIEKDQFLFVFVGRLVRDKGVDELIEAFKRMEKNSCKLLLVGPFETSGSRLKSATLHEIRNNSNIISMGFRSDIRPYLAISNCLVLPSYREGFPNVVLQAGSMELPCIVTDVNGSNEIIYNNVNGIVVGVRNSEAIMHAMQRMILNNDLYIEMKTNARFLISSRFEQNLVWEKILQEYCDLAGSF